MSLETDSGSGIQGERSSLLDTLTCALLPGACVATAAREGAATAAARAEEARILAGGAAVTVAGVPGYIGHETSAGLAETLRAAAEPLAETGSAVRYASVAATVLGVVVLILALLGVAWYVGLIRR